MVSFEGLAGAVEDDYCAMFWFQEAWCYRGQVQAYVFLILRVMQQVFSLIIPNDLVKIDPYFYNFMYADIILVLLFLMLNTALWEKKKIIVRRSMPGNINFMKKFSKDRQSLSKSSHTHTFEVVKVMFNVFVMFLLQFYIFKLLMGGKGIKWSCCLPTCSEVPTTGLLGRGRDQTSAFVTYLLICLITAMH